MGYRRKRNPALRTKQGRQRTIDLPRSLVGTKTPSGGIVPKSFSFPERSFSLPSPPCQLMSWGQEPLGLNPALDTGPLPYGPDIQLNINPPTDGLGSDLSLLEFLQYWGQYNPQTETYPLGASGSLNFNFDLKINFNNGFPPYFNILTLMPGIWLWALRLVSKAEIQFPGEPPSECHFELKNFIPSVVLSNIASTEDSGWIFYQSDELSQSQPPYLHAYFNVTDVPIKKCFWRLGATTNHPPATSFGTVVSSAPGTPLDYGPDANFGLDMNNSFPVSAGNVPFGTKLRIKSIAALFNPLFGFENCSYAITIDGNNFGFTTDPTTGFPISSNAGSNLLTMLPSQEKILVFGPIGG